MVVLQTVTEVLMVDLLMVTGDRTADLLTVMEDRTADLWMDLEETVVVDAIRTLNPRTHQKEAIIIQIITKHMFRLLRHHTTVPRATHS